jgi:phage terminase large subunit GpA-like protein
VPEPILTTLGREWLIGIVDGLIDKITKVKPSEFTEKHRYLPESVSSIPGPMRWDVNPFMVEIVDCFDVDSPVREINIMKGAQITWTTLLESVALYFACHVKTVPVGYTTADKELATERIENNFLPMFNQSGFGNIIQSSDVGNKRKTGKTSKHLQWEGGGYLIPSGALNAAKMRQFSFLLYLKDELDTWPDTKDGDSDFLTDGRCKGYWQRRKIGRGSTPLIKGTSKIYKAFLRGDQRKYYVRCLACGFPQELRWEGETDGRKWGMAWEHDEHGKLVLESVRYLCADCGHGHHEHDKERLFAADHGAEWKPTARPAMPDIRSYQLPAMYSPIGMQPWYDSVSMYLEAYDPIERRVLDVGKYQVFYNNVLAEPWEVRGSRITFQAVSAHRRQCYRYGEIPNEHAKQYAGGQVLFITCQVDVHKGFLAVAVMGWTKDMRCYLIDYFRFEDEDCSLPESKVWGQLREVIEEKEYTADNGRKYAPIITFVDAGWSNDVVCGFAADYSAGVYPIVGVPATKKRQAIKEFSEFKTTLGTTGYRILVDHYKDRLAPVLRREWNEDDGDQKVYHFNMPVDATDRQIKELTKETRTKKVNEKGEVSYEWVRKGNARNELWDLLVYGHAAVEVFAWMVCVGHYELESVDWEKFWGHFELT